MDQEKFNEYFARPAEDVAAKRVEQAEHSERLDKHIQRLQEMSVSPKFDALADRIAELTREDDLMRKEALRVVKAQLGLLYEPTELNSQDL